MLSAKELVEIREKPVPDIPSVGEKSFEPGGSEEEIYQIKNSISEIKNLLSWPRTKMIGLLSKAVWRPKRNLAEVIYQAGSYWSTMGHTVDHKLFIYPEEALYLLETGSLELIFNDVPLSVQRAYFILLNQSTGITIEKYRVYSQLNSNGYKVLRHSPLNTVTKYEKQIEVHKLGIKLKDIASELKSGKRELELENEGSGKRFKVDNQINFPIDYNENDDEKEVFKKIQIFKSYEDNLETSLEFDYDIYVDNSGKQVFKKSCLQIPNYRVIVHRSEDDMPDLKDIARLAKKYKDEVPVIHAIVFPDHVAFYEINPVTVPDMFD